MNRTVGIAISAVVLSITLGVLVGFLIHMSMVQRAERSVPDTPNDPVNVATSQSTQPITVAPPNPSSHAGPSASSGPSGPTSGLVGPPTTLAPSTPPTAPSSDPAAVTTPTTVSHSTPAATTSRTDASSSSPSSPATPGRDSAEGRCATLGDKSADASGTTLFCQRDQGDGSLRWRAVVDGGGCLNQTMTGTGADGRRYDCTLGSNGLNHWVAA